MSALRSSPIIPGMDFPPINREVFLISKNGRCHLYQRCLQLFLQIGTCPPITANTAQVQGQRMKVSLSSMKSQGDMILSFCSQMRLQAPTQHINLLLPERDETAVGHTEREPGSPVHSVRPATLGTHRHTELPGLVGEAATRPSLLVGEKFVQAAARYECSAIPQVLGSHLCR